MLNFHKPYPNGILKRYVLDEQGEHNRPCYYAFKDGKIYWMVPISL